MNMKRKQEVVIKAPLLDGDSMPNMATTGNSRKKEMYITYDLGGTVDGQWAYDAFHICSLNPVKVSNEN